MHWKGYSPSHDEWIPKEDLHAPDLLAEFHSSSSNIRTLQSDVSLACSLLPPTFTHHCQTSSPVYMTMNNNSMESPSISESIRQDMSLPTIPPFSHQENSTPTSLTLSAPSNPITHSSAGVQSPLIHTDNLSTLSASSLSIRPPSLAAPLLSIPSITTATSSQNEILLDINPPPFPTPQHTLLSAGTPPGLVNLFRRSSGLAAPSISKSCRRRMLERTPSHHILDIGGRTVSLAVISIVNTDKEIELLNPPCHLTNTPTDVPAEAFTLPPGWTDQLWVYEQVLGTASLCCAILRYHQANPELSNAMKAWTNHLMPSIKAFAHITPNDLPPISINDYNAIIHLSRRWYGCLRL